MRQNLIAQITAMAERRLSDYAQEMARVLTDELSHPGTGRLYGSHRASRPGEPPAPDTGKLRRSVDISGSGLKRRISVGTDYAADLEFGGRGVAPRPFFRPAIAKFKRLF